MDGGRIEKMGRCIHIAQALARAQVVGAAASVVGGLHGPLSSWHSTRKSPRIVDKSNERCGVWRDTSSLNLGLIGYLIQVSLRDRQCCAHLREKHLHSFWRRITEMERDFRIPNRDRSRQREYSVTQILRASPAESDRSAHIADIIAPVIQHSQQLSVGAQPLVAGSQTCACFEHAAGVFSRNDPPILYAEWLSTQPPLQRLCDGKALVELRQALNNKGTVLTKLE